MNEDISGSGFEPPAIVAGIVGGMIGGLWMVTRPGGWPIVVTGVRWYLVLANGELGCRGDIGPGITEATDDMMAS